MKFDVANCDSQIGFDHGPQNLHRSCSALCSPEVDNIRWVVIQDSEALGDALAEGGKDLILGHGAMCAQRDHDRDVIIGDLCGAQFFQDEWQQGARRTGPCDVTAQDHDPLARVRKLAESLRTDRVV